MNLRLSEIFGTYIESNQKNMNSQGILSESLFEQFYREVRRVLRNERTLSLPLSPQEAADLHFQLQLAGQIPGNTGTMRQTAETTMLALEQLITTELDRDAVEIEQESPELIRRKVEIQEELERLENLIQGKYRQLKYIDEFKQRIGIKVPSFDLESPFQQLPMPPAGNGDRSNSGHF